MIRYQFKLWRLLLSVGLMAAGLAGLGVFVRALSNPPIGSFYEGLLVLFAVPLIGAGVFTLFGKGRLGFYIGFFGQIIAAVSIATVLVGWNAAVEHWSIKFAASVTLFVLCLTTFVLLRKVLGAMRRRANVAGNFRLD